MVIRPIARVVLWMIGTLLSFSAMAVSIRELSATLSIMEILSARAAIGLLIVGALLAIRPQLRRALDRHGACQSEDPSLGGGIGCKAFDGSPGMH